MGHRGGMTLPVPPLGISLFDLAIRNRPRFEGVARSGPLDSASFFSLFTQSAKCRSLSLPLMTRVLGLPLIRYRPAREGKYFTISASSNFLKSLFTQPQGFENFVRLTTPVGSDRGLLPAEVRTGTKPG